MSTFEEQLRLGEIAPGFMTYEFSKAQYFAGPVPVIQSDRALRDMDRVIDMLALQGEFITKGEYTDRKYGPDQDKSLDDLAQQYRYTPLFVRDWLANKNTKHALPLACPHDVREHKPAGKQENTEFWKACRKRDLIAAQILWKSHDIDLELVHAANASIEQITALEYTASQSGKGTSKIMRFLLEAGANPDVRTRDKTPLMRAAIADNVKNTMRLLNALEKRYANEPEKLYEALTVRQESDGYDAYRLALIYSDCGVDAEILEVAQKACAAAKLASPSFTGRDLHADILGELQAAYASGQDIFYRLPLQLAIKGGLLDKVLELAAQAGMKPWEGLMLSNAEVAEAVIEKIAGQGQLPALFAPKHWVGGLRQMQVAWEYVPDIQKEVMDGMNGRPSYADNRHEAMRQTMRTSQDRRPGGRV